jgi:hypothetical protein
MNYVEELAVMVREEMPTELIPEEDAGSLFLLYALLIRVKGSSVVAADVHDAWSVWMTSRGQVHESLVPFSNLPPKTKAEDDPFVDAIRRVASGRTS